MPDDMVAIAGLPLEVTLVKGLKSRPSLAMANSTRGIGNIEPSRLERQTQAGSVNDRLNAFSTWPERQIIPYNYSLLICQSYPKIPLLVFCLKQI